MTTAALEPGQAWTELDDQAMTQLDGGGPFAEFVYDATHTIVSAARFLYDLRPAPAPQLSGGGGAGGW